MEIKSKEITLLSPKKIKPHPKNNNKHPKDQIEHLVKLIEYQGFRNPLIISNLSGYLVAGHARLIAAKKIGLKEVPVIYQDFEDEKQEYLFLTSDNAIQTQSEIDMDMVKVNIEELELGKVDIELLGIKDFSLVSAHLREVDPNKEWDGMPPFDQEDKTSFRHVIVHFTCAEDAKEFFKVIGQNDTGITKSVWFPPQERMDTEAKRYG